MSTLLMCLVLLAPAVPQAPPASRNVSYTFENEVFVVPRLEVTVDAAGNGTVVFTRKSLNKPVERKIVLGAGTRARIDAALDRLNFVASDAVYQSKSEHPNLGTVTLRVTEGEKSREVRFNYTDNEDAASLASLFRGLATREMYAFDLETAARYFPLDTPDLLKTLKEEIGRKRVTEVESLLPLLRDLAGNGRIPLIARNKAQDLADSIARQAPPSASAAHSDKH